MKGQVAHYINYKQAVPEIGMGVILFHFTDRSAGTIVRISDSGKTIWFQEDKAIRTDKNGYYTESQSYKFEANPQGKIYRASKRQDGQWRLANDDRKILVGERDAYHDPSF